MLFFLEKTAAIVTLIIEGIFTLFVTYLLIFHSYLIFNNITTWECLSWSRISYLRDWPRNYGSPFNLGLRSNFRLYFCYDLTKDNYFVWRMPKSRPENSEIE